MKRRGQAIVEVIFAFALAAMAVLALVQVATRSVFNTGSSRRQAVATSYAVAGMEWVRGQRDGLDWATFSGKTGTYCLNNLITTWTAVPAGNCSGAKIGTTEFTRYMIVSQIAGTPLQLQAEVRVEWSEGERVAKSAQTSIFTAY